MFALPRPFRSPEQPSSDLPQARLGARASSRPLPAGEEITRRVSLPAALDRAIEARREVTGESRDEAVAVLLRSALRGAEDGEAPPWASALVSALEVQGSREAVTTPQAMPDTGELAAVAARLSDLATHHRGWLDAHHAALDETHKATGAAVEDLKGFAHTATQVESGLSRLQSSVERASAAQQAIIAKSMAEAARATQAQLDAARAQVEAAQAQMAEFQEAQATHMSGLRGHIDRYRRLLRLTPTVSVSIVAVAVVLGVVTSIVFVPTFQKFTEDAFVQRVVAPTVREEIKKSFAVLKTESEAQTKAFFDLEHERFEKFAQHYRAQIANLKGDKVRLAEEKQRAFSAYNEAKNSAFEWENHARSLEAENARLKKKSGPFGCGVIGSSASGAAPLALFLSPLALVLFSSMRRRTRT